MGTAQSLSLGRNNRGEVPQKLLVQQHRLAEARFFVSKGILLFLNCLFMQKGWQWSLWIFFFFFASWQLGREPMSLSEGFVLLYSIAVSVLLHRSASPKSHLSAHSVYTQHGQSAGSGWALTAGLFPTAGICSHPIKLIGAVRRQGKGCSCSLSLRDLPAKGHWG